MKDSDRGPGSGATSLGAAFKGASKSICVGSSNDGTMLIDLNLTFETVADPCSGLLKVKIVPGA